jgi:hypothetical protein
LFRSETTRGGGPYVWVDSFARSARKGKQMEDILAVVFLFGGGTLFLLSISPVGRALADRLRANARPAQDPELLAEVDALRQELAELQERVDFAERILLSGSERGELKRGEAAR